MGDSTTHPILSMLLTHTTSGQPVITIQRAHPAWPAKTKYARYARAYLKKSMLKKRI